MVRGIRVPVILGIAGLLAIGCGGRSVNEADFGTPDTVYPDGYEVQFDTGKEGVTPDNGKDGIVPNDSATDYDGPVAQGIAAIQQSEESTGCTADGFGNFATGIALDVVIVSPRFTITANSKYGYIVADAGLTQSEAWRGIAITVPVSVSTDEWQPGTAVSLVGDHVEYYCFTQIGVTSATAMGSLPNPAPLVIDPAELGSQDTAQAEKYEGVLVRVNNVEVIETPHNGSDGKDHGSFKATGGLIVANDFRVPYMSTATDSRTVGDRFDYIVGVVKYSYGEYILTPRTADDMVLEGTQPGDNVPDTSEEVVPPDGIEEVVPQDGFEAVDTAGEVNPGSTTIESIQSATESTGCTANSIATIQSGLAFAPIVVVSPKFVASTGKLDGYFVADAGQSTAGEYKGTQMNVDVALATAFQPGDVLNVAGEWVEFYCLTEIKATAAQKTGTGNVPQPRVIQPSALNTQDAATSEPLEGVLVELHDVTVTSANPDEAAGKDYGSFAVADGVIIANTFKLNYMNQATDQRKVGDRFTKIVGVVTYSFSKYVVVPRSNDDLVLEGTVPPDTTEPVVEPVPDVVEPSPEVVDPGTETTTSSYSVHDLQTAAASETCSGGVVNGDPMYGITVKPLLVTSAQYSATSAFHGYYVTDVDGASTDSGMILMVAKALSTSFQPGDVLAVTGDYKEYYCMSEVVVASTATPPATVGSVVKTGTDSIPDPIVLSASVLENGGGAAAEKYEGMIVTINNVQVTSTTSPDTYGWFQVGNGIEIVSDFFYPVATAPYTPVLNDTLPAITGGLKFHHGRYRIAPRTAADFTKVP